MLCVFFTFYKYVCDDKPVKLFYAHLMVKTII